MKNKNIKFYWFELPFLLSKTINQEIFNNINNNKCLFIYPQTPTSIYNNNNNFNKNKNQPPINNPMGVEDNNKIKSTIYVQSPGLLSKSL